MGVLIGYCFERTLQSIKIINTTSPVLLLGVLCQVFLERKKMAGNGMRDVAPVFARLRQ